MTDALGEASDGIQRVGLRNPVRVVVRVETKKDVKGKGKGKDEGHTEKEDRRTPARYIILGSQSLHSH